MDLNSLNLNVNRLLTNIWSMISFLKEFTVDASKDVSITYLNADGSENVRTFKNIAKTVGELDNWRAGFIAPNINNFKGYYSPALPGSATNITELNHLNISFSGITRQSIDVGLTNNTHANVDIERFLAQVVRHQLAYAIWGTGAVILRGTWATNAAHVSRIDNQFRNPNFYGSITEACWARVPVGSLAPIVIGGGWTIVWQHPSAKNSDGSYNVNNWHLWGAKRSKTPGHTTLSFPMSSSGQIELFGYNRIDGHLAIEQGMWFPIKQVGHKNSALAAGGLKGQVK